MDYEKKYKEAIYLLKELRPKISDYYREKLDGLFPEITESKDEKIRRCIGDVVRKYGVEFATGTITKEKMLAWLEKQGEHKSVWNEDDEAILKAIIQDIQERHPDAMWNINTSKTAAVSTKFIIKFLKSLSPQLHWKPTEEQINAFEHFVRSIGESGYASPYDNNTKLIYSLLDDLKKLL